MTAPTRSLHARRVDGQLYEIPRDPSHGMRVPARVYADEALWEQIAQESQFKPRE